MSGLHRLLLLSLPLLGGCVAQELAVRSIEGRFNQLTIELAEPPVAGDYRLSGASGEAVAVATVTGNQLQFTLPVEPNRAAEPLQVSGPEGKIAFSGVGSQIEHPLWREHQQHYREAFELQQRLQQLQGELAEQRKLQQEAKGWLDLRPSFYQPPEGCRPPARFERSAVACSAEERNARAVWLCGTVMGDCQSLLHLTRDDTTQRILKEERCDSEIERLQSLDHEWKSEIEPFIPPPPPSDPAVMTDSGNPMLQAFGMMYKARLLRDNIQLFLRCQQTMGALCQRVEEDWQLGADGLMAQCLEQESILNRTQQSIEPLQQEWERLQPQLQQTITRMQTLQQQQLTIAPTRSAVDQPPAADDASGD